MCGKNPNNLDSLNQATVNEIKLAEEATSLLENSLIDLCRLESANLALYEWTLGYGFE